jgi:hypothetical protein
MQRLQYKTGSTRACRPVFTDHTSPSRGRSRLQPVSGRRGLLWSSQAGAALAAAQIAQVQRWKDEYGEIEYGGLPVITRQFRRALLNAAYRRLMHLQPAGNCARWDKRLGHGQHLDDHFRLDLRSPLAH